jgi:exodeoxyribonuclease V gamma subunit
VDQAEEELAVLLECYRRGLRGFLRFFPASSMAYAEQLASERSADACLQAARSAWAYVGYPEKNDPYYKQFFGDTFPMDHDFEETAKAVCLPLIEHRRERK